jgi:hypothetical protein
MSEPNPDHWASTHMRWLALSRWDNEGGASASRLTAKLTKSTQPRRRNQGATPQPSGVRSVAAVDRRRTEMIEAAKRAGPTRAQPG